MNYFELFEIPVSLKVDTGALQSRFFELSRKYHPDFYANAVPALQAEALEKSAMLNKAWKTFGDPDATIKYVLKSKELLADEEKYDLPPEFLMEVLEINEELMDRGENTDKVLAERIRKIEKEIYAPVEEIINRFNEETTSQEELLQVKEYYFKKKYLDRIRDQLQ